MSASLLQSTMWRTAVLNGFLFWGLELDIVHTARFLQEQHFHKSWFPPKPAHLIMTNLTPEVSFLWQQRRDPESTIPEVRWLEIFHLTQVCKSSNEIIHTADDTSQESCSYIMFCFPLMFTLKLFSAAQALKYMGYVWLQELSAGVLLCFMVTNRDIKQCIQFSD